MSAKTKIVVLHRKELVICGVLVLLAALFIILFVNLAGSKADEDAVETTETMTYIPGVYTSNVTLGDSTVEVQVTLDEDHINSIELVNLDESVETMYPLVTPALEELSSQILEKQSLEDITYQAENQYTSLVLYNAIVSAVKKASPE
jgi:uncharacterized protein with FMN-binding domain